MLIIGQGKTVPDDEVVFYDGFLYVICREEFAYKIDVMCLDPEYDQPVSLAEIAEVHPDVCKVIYEDALSGEIYNYGNHIRCDRDAEAWEQIGTTCGYA